MIITYIVHKVASYYSNLYVHLCHQFQMMVLKDISYYVYAKAVESHIKVIKLMYIHMYNHCTFISDS